MFQQPFTMMRWLPLFMPQSVWGGHKTWDPFIWRVHKKLIHSDEGQSQILVKTPTRYYGFTYKFSQFSRKEHPHHPSNQLIYLHTVFIRNKGLVLYNLYKHWLKWFTCTWSCFFKVLFSMYTVFLSKMDLQPWRKRSLTLTCA